LWRLRRPGWRPGFPTHVRLLSFSRCGASGWGRASLVGLWSPAPKEVHPLVALEAPGLAPRLAQACATVVALALWRLWRGVRCFRRLEEPNAQEHIPSCGVVAPGLTAKRANVRAAVVTFALRRLWCWLTWPWGSASVSICRCGNGSFPDYLLWLSWPRCRVIRRLDGVIDASLRQQRSVLVTLLLDP